MEETANTQGRHTTAEHPSSLNEPQEKIEIKVAKTKRSRALPIVGAVFALILLSLAAIAILMRGPRGSGNDDLENAYFELPLDEVVPEMISAFDGLRFSVTNAEHIIEIGNFAAKRVSAVNGRVRVNFNAIACEQASDCRWETSVLIEFFLGSDGNRLKAEDVTVRRCHIYDLPKTLGNDELEYDPRVVSILKSKMQSTNEIVADSQKVIDVKLSADDTIKISWENIK